MAGGEIKTTIMDFSVGGDADLLYNFWMADGADAPPNPQNERAIKQWLENNMIDESAVYFFIRGSGYEAARARAAVDLGLR